MQLLWLHDGARSLQKDGLEYCCESCVTDSEACDCGCFHPAEEQREEY
jgi:hypothetical protein